MPPTNEQIIKGAKTQAALGTVSAVLEGAASLYSGILGRKTAKTYGRMQQRAAETQARLNEIATERNIAYQTRQAADQISDIKRQGRQVVGSQLAAMAATGMSTASGSAQALIRSTGYSVGRDVSTVQANLMNSAFEQRRQMAIENIALRYQGEMAQYAAKAEGFNQLAQGVSGLMSATTSVASKWNRYYDLQMVNKNTPIMTPESAAWMRSGTELAMYSGYGSPSLTGIEYGFKDTTGTANNIPNLSLSPINENIKKYAMGRYYISRKPQ